MKYGEGERNQGKVSVSELQFLISIGTILPWEGELTDSCYLGYYILLLLLFLRYGLIRNTASVYWYWRILQYMIKCYYIRRIGVDEYEDTRILVSLNS